MQGLWDVASLDESESLHTYPSSRTAGSAFSPNHSVSITVVPSSISPLYSHNKRAPKEPSSGFLDDRRAASLLQGIRANPDARTLSELCASPVSPHLYIASPAPFHGGNHRYVYLSLRCGLHQQFSGE